MILISLFSGIGGFELAAEQVGWKTYLTCEIDDFCNAILEYYWPQAYHHKDIHTLTHDTVQTELSRRFGTDWRKEPVIITGGFPCQPYSLAGKRKGKDDNRHLWPQMLRVIKEISPDWILGENVYGIINWDRGMVFHEIQTDLENAGYEVQPYVLPACGVNAPHRRDRVWFVAHSTGRSTGSPGQGGRITGERCGNIDEPEKWRIEAKQHIGWSDVLSGEGITSDTDCRGLEGSIEVGRNGEYVVGESESWATSDTCNTRLPGAEWRKSYGKTRREETYDTTPKCFKIQSWNEWPTQSPICSGNDGVSTRLDVASFLGRIPSESRHTISYARWRKESIKAYGNAVVPELVVNIFKAINEFIHNEHDH